MGVLKNRGLAFRMSVLILLATTVIFSVIYTYNYLIYRQIIIENIEKKARFLTIATANHIDTVLKSVEKVPANMAHFLGHTEYTMDDLLDLIRVVVDKNMEIFGSCIAYAPYAYLPKAERFAPYFYKNGDQISFTYLPYNYFNSDWYQSPRELNRPIWSEPYYDEGAGNVVMTTYSVPFYVNDQGQKKLRGVVTADISLDWLEEIMSSIKIAQTGYGFLISKHGTIVTHPDQNLIMNESIFSVAEEHNDTHMRAVGQAMTRGGSGFVPFTSLTGKKVWIAYTPLRSNGWSLGVIFPQKELMADVIQLNRRILFLGSIGFVVMLVIIAWIARSITRPIRTLSLATEDIARGNLEGHLPTISTGDEVGKLADAFSNMKHSLQEYIHELTETTAANERMESELQIARDIQRGILPVNFPAFPHRNEIEIFATLLPQKEVGGDLYDFFFIDQDHLCFTVGDVAGKGIPASLFMVITDTLIKAKSTAEICPDIVLSRVNEALCADNPSMMFVTLFMGILNVRNGELCYSNGGHNPPYLITANGGLAPLPTTDGMALGVMEQITYRSRTIRLNAGDTIFLFTDGVNEAINKDEAFFGEARLARELDKCKDCTVEEIVAFLLADVQEFCRDAPQTDDITMMTLRYNGDSRTVT